jgi:tricorn protease
VKKESDNTKSKNKKNDADEEKADKAKIEPVKLILKDFNNAALPSCKTYMQLEAAKEVILYSEQEPNKRPFTSSIYTRKRESENWLKVSLVLRSLQKVRNIYMRPTINLISKVAEKPDPKETLKIANIEIKVDPVLEWKQIFREAWR